MVNKQKHLMQNEKQYSALVAGETIQATDEYQLRDGTWKQHGAASNSLGDEITSEDFWLPHRRPITPPTLTLEVGKCYKTRDGRKARVICAEATTTYLSRRQPIIALVANSSGTGETQETYGADGSYDTCQTSYDLLSLWQDLPEVGEGWRLLVDYKEVVLPGDSVMAVSRSSTYSPKSHWWSEGDFNGHAGKTLADAKAFADKEACDIYFRRRTTPLVDWSALPVWAKWACKDENGEWTVFSHKPVMEANEWLCYGSDHKCADADIGVIQLPTSHFPSFSGDWKLSLVAREEGK